MNLYLLFSVVAISYNVLRVNAGTLTTLTGACNCIFETLLLKKDF
jgi:hypothetical protein